MLFPVWLDKMRTRGRGVKPIGKILRFAGHQPFAEFHDADRVRRCAVITQYEFGDPEIAAADHPPHRKALVVGLDGSALLNVAAAADPLARLRITKHGVVAVDFMFGLEVAGVRSLPMALQRRPHGSIVHLKLPLWRAFARRRLHPVRIRPLQTRYALDGKVAVTTPDRPLSGTRRPPSSQYKCRQLLPFCHGFGRCLRPSIACPS